MIPEPVDSTNPSIILSSPLTVLGVFVEILRQRFAEGIYSNPALDWVWKPELSTTGIFIESGYNTNIEARTTRPGIWIDREQNLYQQAAIGHQDQRSMNIQMNLSMFYAIGEMDLSFWCTSPNRGESMMIGSIVQDFLQMSSDIIQAKFGFRNLSDVIMNKTQPMEKDDQLWNTTLEVRAQYEIRWATMPAENLLRSIAATISNQDNPEEYLQKITLQQPFDT